MKRTVCLLTAMSAAALLIAQIPADWGFKDTPMLPGGKWHVHDPDRPRPKEVQPAARPGDPPSDAIVLFDGKDLSRWESREKGGAMVPAKWKADGGVLTIAPGTGDLFTKDKFGDCQVHIEWAAPLDVKGTSQARGNSGVFLMSRYEIQVLDTYHDRTYADGGAGAVYGQFPPMVNPIRPTGEWNVYDILFEAPKFKDRKMVKPAYQTVIFNGVAVHMHQELLGKMTYRQVGYYEPHGDEEPISLQDHRNAVRFRNIWVRRLAKAE